MRTLIAALVALAVAGSAGCSGSQPHGPYGARAAHMGVSVPLLGWDMTVSNVRWEADRVLIDVAATAQDPTDPTTPHAKPADIRFGVYGAPARPTEANGIGSCDPLLGLTSRPLAAPVPDRLSGTVCLGPLKDRSVLRGIYAYSTADRIPQTTVAYPASFPVGVPPANADETGLTLTNTGVTAWRADGTPLAPAALGDVAAFTGNGYMLLNLTADAPAARYRADAVARGGPLMLIAAPSAPVPQLSPACSVFGSSSLILPEASLNAVHVSTSLCTHGEINAALLYASLTVAGTHAAVWLNS